MELVIEAVASHKQGIKAQGKWFSADKFSKITFEGLTPGDVIDVTDKDEKGDKTYIKAFKLASGGTLPAKPSGSSAKPSYNDNKDASIARAVALKAAVDMCSEEGGIDEIAANVVTYAKSFETYLLTGVFGEIK